MTLFTVLSSLRSPGDQAEVLREAARVLAPGGLLLIWEPRVPVPFNRRTVHLRRATVRKALGSDADWVSLTLLPPLARRLGARTASAYPRLARLPALRTHRLGAYRRP